MLAQERDRPARIATLDPGREGDQSELWARFRKRLQELGYVEGVGFAIDRRWGNSELARLPALAAELVAQHPDVIVTTNTATALAAKQATSSIPIVSIGAAAPVENGLIVSFARPGANLTGVSPLLAEIAGKWIELLLEIAPKVKSIAFLAIAGNPAATQVFGQLETAAKSRGLSMQMLDCRDRSAIERAFAAISRERIEAAIVGSPAGLLGYKEQITEAAARQRIPAIYPRREFVEAGGLMSFATDFGALFSRAADYVHRILQGAKPSGLPFERAAVFELVVNLKAARQLGLKIPQSVLVRAEEVIR